MCIFCNCLIYTYKGAKYGSSGIWSDGIQKNVCAVLSLTFASSSLQVIYVILTSRERHHSYIVPNLRFLSSHHLVYNDIRESCNHPNSWFSTIIHYHSKFQKTPKYLLDCQLFCYVLFLIPNWGNTCASDKMDSSRHHTLRSEKAKRFGLWIIGLCLANRPLVSCRAYGCFI